MCIQQPFEIILYNSKLDYTKKFIKSLHYQMNLKVAISKKPHLIKSSTWAQRTQYTILECEILGPLKMQPSPSPIAIPIQQPMHCNSMPIAQFNLTVFKNMKRNLNIYRFRLAFFKHAPYPPNQIEEPKFISRHVRTCCT